MKRKNRHTRRASKATIRQRLEALEAGGGAEDEAERYAFSARECAKRCEELGIPGSTEAERAEFRRKLDAAKPENWRELTETERGVFLINHIMEGIRAEEASETA